MLPIFYRGMLAHAGMRGQMLCAHLMRRMVQMCLQRWIRGALCRRFHLVRMHAAARVLQRFCRRCCEKDWNAAAEIIQHAQDLRIVREEWSSALAGGASLSPSS